MTNHARLLLAAAFVWLAAACTTPVAPQPTGAAAPQPAGFPLTVAGSDGESLTLERPPQRIISLSPGATETLFAVGAGDQVVAVDRFSDFPRETSELPKVDYTSPNLEALLALSPDLILASGRQRAQLASFQQAGLRTLFLEEPGNLAETIEGIRLIGRIAGTSPRADEVAAAVQRRIDAVKAEVATVAVGPRVYHELDPALFTAAANTFVGDFYEVLKAQNIAANAPTPFPQLTDEAVIAANPEVIVLADARFMPGGAAAIEQRPGWGAISAVQTKRVYSIEDDPVSRPGPRIAEGLESLAKALYPDRFR